MRIAIAVRWAMVAAALLTGCVRDNRPMTASDNFMGTGAVAPKATQAPMASGTAHAPAASGANNIDVVKSPQ